MFWVPSLILGLRARITGRADRFDVAAEAAQVVLDSPSPPFYVLLARAGLGLMAAYSEDVQSAQEQYKTLLASQGTMIASSVTSDRLLGLLSHTMGDLDQAAAHFEDALTFCRKAGYRPELAGTCCDYADALLERDAEGDSEKAVRLLDDSRLTCNSPRTLAWLPVGEIDMGGADAECTIASVSNLQ